MTLGSDYSVLDIGWTIAVLLFYVVVFFLLYFLPTIVGSLRTVPDIGSVAKINLFLGWTVVGWVVALAMALRSARASPIEASASVSPAGDATIEGFKQLADLHERGQLTDEEFAAAKAQLLNHARPT